MQITGWVWRQMSLSERMLMLQIKAAQSKQRWAARNVI